MRVNVCSILFAILAGYETFGTSEKLLSRDRRINL